ncbi:MAG: MFS transporter [Corynebacteriales bacterium]|nr:MFS transporter [Mycobacteriales bacterium]
MSTHPATAAKPQEPPGEPNYLIPFLGIMGAMLLAMLDGMIVGTAMPTIVDELGGARDLSWVVTAYLLTSMITTPLYGKLGDLFGHKTMFLSAIGIFLGGSVLSGAAHTMTQLIMFRAIQGIGAGGLLVCGMALIGHVIPFKKMGSYQGISGGIMGAAMIGGPFLGGLITDHLSWRWAFYINLPVGAVVIAVISLAIHIKREKRPVKIDYVGAALIAVIASALVLFTSWAGDRYDWASPQIIGLGMLAAIGIGLLVLVERRAAEPMLPLTLFQNRNLTLAAAIAAAHGFVMFGAMTFLPLYQQVVQGASATNSGAQLFPLLAGTLVTSIVVGKSVSKTGRYRIFPLLGFAVSIAGLIMLATLAGDTSKLVSALFMLVFGVGLGLIWQIPTIIAMRSTAKSQLGVASGLVRFMQSVGGALGVAVAGAIFVHGVGSARPTDGRYLETYANAIGGIFLWAIPIAASGLVLAWLLRESPLNDDEDVNAPASMAREQEAALAAH